VTLAWCRRLYLPSCQFFPSLDYKPSVYPAGEYALLCKAPFCWISLPAALFLFFSSCSVACDFSLFFF
jgi:hypothetical protein